MDEKRIEEIVQQVFDRAKLSCASSAKSALSKIIAHQIQEKYEYIHSKTLERAYDKYLIKKEKIGSLQADKVDLLCKYLEYKNYGDFIKKNPVVSSPTKVKIDQKQEEENNDLKKKRKWLLPTSISIAVVAILIVSPTLKSFLNKSSVTTKETPCMTWAKTHYEEISCAVKPFSKYGTLVETYEKLKILNFKKIEVTMSTDFFNEDTNKPLVWYHKTKNSEVEYFSAPGLHPINKETLLKITPHIIQKYVPIHSINEDSFAK